jgi:hypothetical protein
MPISSKYSLVTSGSLNKTIYICTFSPRTCHMLRPSHCLWFGHCYLVRSSWLCSILLQPVTRPTHTAVRYSITGHNWGAREHSEQSLGATPKPRNFRKISEVQMTTLTHSVLSFWSANDYTNAFGCNTSECKWLD